MTAGQIPKGAVLWLLLSTLASLLLHSTHLPVGFWLLALVVGVWRWLIHLGRVSYPTTLIKVIAVVVTTVAVIVTFDRSVSLESASAFLIAACLLKQLEMRTVRDAQIVVYMAFLLLATGFLFQQDIGSALWGILTAGMITSAMIAVQQNPYTASLDSLRVNATLAARVLLLSLPIMLILYFLFPRLGPLWSVGLQSSQAKTGMTDMMAPADIAQLSQSSELAFRVSFDQQQPSRSELYWRGLTLDHYDGRRWQVASATSTAAAVSWAPSEKPLGVFIDDLPIVYDIIQEPTDQSWLFSLQGVQAIEANTGRTLDDRLLARRPVYQRQRYRAQSWPQVRLDEAGLSAAVRQQQLQLPAQGNPQARAWAQTLRHALTDDREIIATVMATFSDQPFHYTLQPQPLGQHDIDEFLFSTQRGFCAHYAGAMVFVARAAGIPARVVVGYQGGEWNAQEGYLSVRQFDAHAWVEVWFPDRGWQRFDPTEQVAPDRIEYGLQRALGRDEGFLREQPFSMHRLQHVAWLNRIRLQLDSVNYYWHRWVLSYDRQRQRQFLQGWLGMKTYQDILYGLAMSVALVFVVGSAWLVWQQRPRYRNRYMRAWIRLQQRAERYGVSSREGETVNQYLQRLALAFPALRSHITRLNHALEDYLYRTDAIHNPEQTRLIIRQLVRLRWRLSAKHKNSLDQPHS